MAVLFVMLLWWILLAQSCKEVTGSNVLIGGILIVQSVLEDMYVRIAPACLKGHLIKEASIRSCDQKLYRSHLSFASS